MKKIVLGLLLSVGILVGGAGQITPNVDPIHVGTGTMDVPPIVINVDPIHVG